MKLDAHCVTLTSTEYVVCCVAKKRRPLHFDLSSHLDNENVTNGVFTLSNTPIGYKM